MGQLAGPRLGPRTGAGSQISSDRERGTEMPKSSQRNRTEGFLDRVGGRILAAWGALTGKRGTEAKGKAAGVRGRMRGGAGRAKKAAK